MQIAFRARVHKKSTLVLVYLGVCLGVCLGLLPFRSASCDLGIPAASRTLCPGIEATSSIKPPLSTKELAGICGGSPTEAPEGVKRGFIPRSVVVARLKEALRSRGYLNPAIENTESGVKVDPGPRLRATSIRAEGAPGFLDFSRRRDLLGEPVTPKLLGSIEDWALGELSSHGFPCALVQATPDARTGEVVVRVEPGSPFQIQTIENLETGLINPDVLRRFDPFKPGDLYDSRLLSLSSRRAVRDGIVERSFFEPVCGREEGVVRQHATTGRPRTYTLGLSLDTEVVALLQLAYKRVRLGENASSVTLEGNASFRDQEISAYADWRAFPSPSSRSFLRPQLSALHENESPYEFYSERALFGYGTGADWSDLGLGLVAGPRYEYFQSLRGFGAGDPHGLELTVELEGLSHDFELSRARRFGGYHFIIVGDAHDARLASTFGATRIQARGEWIHGIGGRVLPALLLDLRGQYGLTVVEGGPGNSFRLPPDYLQYLGGHATLRGFGRLELPAESGEGGLSSAYLGMDLRLAALSQSLEPFAFLDLGEIGMNTAGLGGPLFWSPGFGLAWYSPIGPIRSTLGHGYVSGAGSSARPELSHWQFFMSIGEPI